MNVEVKHHSLSEIQKIISKTLKERFTQSLWVIAEIAEIKINYSGHCYLELIEKNDGSAEISARIRGIMWSKQARFIMPYFQSTTGSHLAEGMKILIKAGVEYNSVYGLSLIISDIDPTYTLGELAIKKTKVVKRLEEEGVIDMNHHLSFPMFPGRVAVISSENAAGLSDFMDHLCSNVQGYRFITTLFPALMQGTETSASVTSALNKIYEKIDKFDVVVIVRGGGSQSDLSWFDDYDIAYMITQFPIPVITGIGHEKDISVCDMVAFARLKTPTAVADFLIEKTMLTESSLENIGRRIAEVMGNRIAEVSTILEQGINSIKPLTDKLIKAQKEKLSRSIIRIPSLSRIVLINNLNRITSLQKEISYNSKRIVEQGQLRLINIETDCPDLLNKMIVSKKEKLNIIEKSIKNMSADSVLKRGFSITTLNGKTIKDIKQVKEGDKVISIIKNGTIESEVFDIKE